MKPKTIVVFCAVLLVAASLLFASDLKPFKGWVQQIDTRTMTVDEARGYEFLNDVIGSHNPLLLYGMYFTIYKGVNNVGGASIHENAQMFYVKPDFTGLEFYEASTVTVANGDQIFITVEGIFDFAKNTWTAADTVVGGTGRFEGAVGSLIAKPSVDSHEKPIIVLDGYVTTVGAAKKH
jgi:hypothetical protein